MKQKVLVPKTADRAKVVGKILDPSASFVEWAGNNCCYTSCTYCRPADKTN